MKVSNLFDQNYNFEENNNMLQINHFQKHHGENKQRREPVSLLATPSTEADTAA